MALALALAYALAPFAWQLLWASYFLTLLMLPEFLLALALEPRS